MKKFCVTVLLGFSLVSNLAGAASCSGKVIKVLDWPTQCNGLIAFMTTATNGMWICSPSAKTESLVLMAYAADKSVTVALDSSLAPDCGSVQHYHKPSYVVVFN